MSTVSIFFLAQGLEGLAAGVVKLAGLTNLQRAGTENQYLLYMLFYHDCFNVSTNLSNINSVSTGPEQASGWNCELNQGVLLVADTLVGGIVHIDEELLPVLVQRARIDGVAVVLRGDEALLRAHHAHRLVVAAVAVLQLIDCGASSLESNWLPMQIPQMGLRLRLICLRMISTASEHMSGSPGPLARKRPSNSMSV